MSSTSMLGEKKEVVSSCCVPPGFRFHPTEEELVGYYLARKVSSLNIDLDIIPELDLYRIEPWHLQERCSSWPAGGGGHGGGEEQTSWYFFSYKDRKYPSGRRTNRATAAGFWKATGRDKPVLSSSSSSRPAPVVIGTRKTLVFYRGRAPTGAKTDWIIHEYSLLLPAVDQHDDEASAAAAAAGWVVCRAFHKPAASTTAAALQFRPPLSGFSPTAAGYYDVQLPLVAGARMPHLVDDQYRRLLMSTPLAGGGGGVREQEELYGCCLEEESKIVLSDMVPQLLSPTAMAQPPPPPAADHRLDEDEQLVLLQQQGLGAGAIDWNFLDSLLLTSTTSSSTLLH